MLYQVSFGIMFGYVSMSLISGVPPTLLHFIMVATMGVLAFTFPKKVKEK